MSAWWLLAAGAGGFALGAWFGVRIIVGYINDAIARHW